MKINFLDTTRKNKITSFLKEWESNDDFISANTSGSTGQAKKIELKKKHLLISARKTLDYLKIPDFSVFHLGLSSDTIAGKMMLVRALVNQAELIVSEVSANCLASIKRPIQFSALVPLQLEKYLSENQQIVVDTIIVGGAPISEQLEKKAALNKSNIYHTFGMTETISHVAMRKLTNEHKNPYLALPGIEFSQNTLNELIIHFPEINKSPIATNDVVDLLDKFTFNWIGRTDFCVNSGGIKIFPENIERRLDLFIPLPYFISHIPDVHLGQALVLIIESNEAIKIDKTAFSHFLSSYETPRYYQCIPNFTKTASGKINRTLTQAKISNDAWRKIL